LKAPKGGVPAKENGMLASWMVYALAVTALVAAGARMLESARPQGCGTLRWGWLAALVATPVLVLLPPLLPVFTTGNGGGGGSAGFAFSVVPDGSGTGAAVEAARGVPAMLEALMSGLGAAMSALSPWMLAAWVVASVLLLGRLVFSCMALRRAAARWPRSRVDGSEVLVSDGVGPGLLGVLRAMTVLPPWCLELDPVDRALVVAHEEEHRRCGDAVLLALSRLLLLAAPWNAPLWWMDRRLRIAVELDCDVRVAARHPQSLRRYARLLVDTAARPRAPLVPTRHAATLALFAEPNTPLHRRIDMLTRTNAAPSPGRAILLGTGAAVLLAAAAFVPGCESGILSPDDARLSEAVEGDRTDAVTEADAEPTFTPFTVAPEVRNRADVARALEREYPPLLRDAGVGGTVLLYFRIGDDGGVEHIRLHESSGHTALDEAALRVADRFEFSPAFNRDQRVPVWIQIPITFTIQAGDGVRAESEAERLPFTREQAEERASARATASDGDGPTFTPFTVAPEMTNRPTVARALEREYPPLLRDAGVGGTAMLYLYVDADGRVQDIRVHETSGHQAIDQAALRVAAEMEFTAARNRDAPVPVWMQIPITFTTR
jgi:TonB family protein